MKAFLIRSDKPFTARNRPFSVMKEEGMQQERSIRAVNDQTRCT
jgi:hypothetical protein